MEKEINRGRKKKEIDGEFAEILSKLLQEAKEKGISQDNIAQAIGVSRQSLGKWANGVTVPDILDLKKLSKYFNVSADYLLGLSNNATTDTDLKAVCDYTGLSEESIKQIVMETKVGFDFEIRTLDWIISSEYIFSIDVLLGVIGENSEKYLKMEKLYDEKYGKFKTHRVSEAENKMLDELDALNNLIDTDRYRLIKLSEEMSNLFDKRKELERNGEHNPKNE